MGPSLKALGSGRGKFKPSCLTCLQYSVSILSVGEDKAGKLLKVLLRNDLPGPNPLPWLLVSSDAHSISNGIDLGGICRDLCHCCHFFHKVLFESSLINDQFTVQK